MTGFNASTASISPGGGSPGDGIPPGWWSQADGERFGDVVGGSCEEALPFGDRHVRSAAVVIDAGFLRVGHVVGQEVDEGVIRHRERARIAERTHRLSQRGVVVGGAANVPVVVIVDEVEGLGANDPGLAVGVVAELHELDVLDLDIVREELPQRKRASPVRLSLKSGTSSTSSPMLPEISTMSCTSTVCNVPTGTVRVLGSATGTSSITLMEKLAIGSMSPGSPVSRTRRDCSG